MISSLLALFTVISELLTLGFKAWGLLQEAKMNGWIKEGRTLSETISNAKTPEERAALAKLLFEHTP
jgi:hypothetical protein